jgi:hypothetical protein
MSSRSFWSVCAVSTAASVVLASCGGGVGEILASVAFIGSAGGSWQEDDNSAQPGLQQRFACDWDANGIGIAGADSCFINIQPANPPANLYATAFAVTFTGNLPGCPQASTDGGRIDGKRINLPGCFTGEYININESLSDGGAHRMFFDFTPDLTQGVWVEIQDGQRRFKFSSNSTGCEYSAAGLPTVTTVILDSDVSNAAGPFETTISAFTVAGDAAGAWSGRFAGTSAMSLRRGNEVLELQRRDESPATPCP